MEDLFVFIFSFIIIFFLNICAYIAKRKKKQLKKMKEIIILSNYYKLNRNELNVNRLGLLFAFVNSLIIAVAGTLCTMMDTHILWQLLSAFALLMALLIICYTIIGYTLKLKEGKKK